MCMCQVPSEEGRVNKSADPSIFLVLSIVILCIINAAVFLPLFCQESSGTSGARHVEGDTESKRVQFLQSVWGKGVCNVKGARQMLGLVRIQQ
jgi:hypothetical protein